MNERIEHGRGKKDRLRKHPRRSDLTLRGSDLDWFRLNVVGYHHKLASPGDECWIWRGMFTGAGSPFMRIHEGTAPKRPGLSYRPGKRVGARRAAYATWIRPLKADEVVRAECGDYRCVNPAHLSARAHEGEQDWMHTNARATVRHRANEGRDDRDPSLPGGQLFASGS